MHVSHIGYKEYLDSKKKEDEIKIKQKTDKKRKLEEIKNLNVKKRAIVLSLKGVDEKLFNLKDDQ